MFSSIALDGRESREQIDGWLDMATAQEVVEKFLGLSQFKKTESDGKGKWRNLFASIVSNTSLTMKDIADLCSAVGNGKGSSGEG